MFQYTSETIINSNAGNLKLVNSAGNGYDAAVRFAAVTADGKAAGDSNADAFIVDGVVSLKKADIKRAWKTPYMAEEMAKVEITLANCTSGHAVRLVVRLGEQGRSSAILQNAFLKKSRPFVYEIISSGVAATDAAKLVKMINREMAETDFKFFNAAADGAKITLTGADCYVRFTNAAGEVMPVGEKAVVFEEVTLDSNTGFEAATEVKAEGVVKALGSQGAGTVARIIKDLRIPSTAKVDPFELKDGGMPVPGGKYDQYLVEVETARREISGGVVGQLSTSLTSFVFFVESAATAAFAAELGKCVTVGEAGIPVSSEVASGKRPAGAAEGAEEVKVETTGEVVFKKKA